MYVCMYVCMYVRTYSSDSSRPLLAREQLHGRGSNMQSGRGLYLWHSLPACRPANEQVDVNCTDSLPFVCMYVCVGGRGIHVTYM